MVDHGRAGLWTVTASQRLVVIGLRGVNRQPVIGEVTCAARTRSGWNPLVTGDGPDVGEVVTLQPGPQVGIVTVGFIGDKPYRCDQTFEDAHGQFGL